MLGHKGGKHNIQLFKATPFGTIDNFALEVLCSHGKIHSVSQARSQKPSTEKASLTDIYTKIPYFSEAQLKLMQNLTGPRWADILLHLPSGMIDRSHTPTIEEVEIGTLATLKVIVTKGASAPYKRSRRPSIVQVADDTGKLKLLFFHYGSWLSRAFPVGEEVLIAGKIEGTEQDKRMVHPNVWPAGKSLENVAKLWPVYPATAGLGQASITRAVQTALKACEGMKEPQWYPANIAKQVAEWPGFYESLNIVHNPESPNDGLPTSAVRTRLGFDEILANQLALLIARQKVKKIKGLAQTPAHQGSGLTGNLVHKGATQLPFDLTGDQQSVLTEILQDMATPTPMLRLVQGDVGSGKTAVALLALLQTVDCGHQGVLMAPTEILAHQHFESARQLLEPLGLNVALLSGSVPAAKKKKIKQLIKEGVVHIVVGTHALVQGDMQFDSLGLVVVDEQHRFGVEQRAKLTGSHTPPPDVLIMTATPIPRTLALTFYGDMAVSNIREKPPGRTPIETKVLPQAKLPDLANSLQRVLDKNEQVYWVCPLVEESEESDLTAATERFETLQQIYGGNVALLHGKMKPALKESTMAGFKAGDTKILIATTVIEVGVDVPKASVMVIEHAERFGLAQLHQLRGRVGRGAAASSCILLYAHNLSDIAQERLQAMRDSDDGFYLAEKDLELRGPGEVLGTRQSGQLVTRVADLYHHKDLIPLAREAAEYALEQGKKLPTEHRQGLRQLLTIFGKERASTLLKGG